MKPGSWPTILLLYAYGVVATSIVSQASPIVGSIAKFYHLSNTNAGWIISIPSLVTAVGALMGGWLTDRVGEKRVLFVGCLLTLVGNLLVFFSDSPAMLWGGRLLEGGGYLSLTVGAATMIMRTTEGDRRSTALGLWTSHTAVGIGATLLIVAPLAHSPEGWRWSFGGQAIVAALLAVSVLFLPRPQAPVVARRLSDIGLVLRSPNPYRVALASLATALLQTGVMAALVVFMSKTFHVSIPAAAGVGTIAEVVNALGCLLVGPLLKRRVAPVAVGVTGGLILLSGALMLYLPGVSFLCAATGVAVFSLGIGLTNGLIWALVPKTAPSPQTLGVTGGLVAQATYLGVLLGPPLIFSSFHADGWKQRIALVVAMAVLQVAPLPIWRRSRRPVGDLKLASDAG